MSSNVKTEQIQLNKNLDLDFEIFKANITKKRYDYYDFSREKVQEIANKDIGEVGGDVRILVQALFPQHLQCSGLFDGFILFNVVDGVRIDPPVYWYHSCSSYLNNDNKAKVNRLADEIKDLFESNGIQYSEGWKEYFNHFSGQEEL